MTQEKNVKVSRFPLIYLDETILAHTNLAEFRKFLQESENEALLDRMVIIQVPYTLNYKDEARIYKKLISSAAPAFREVHLDPHVLHAAAVFATLTRLHEGEEKETELSKKVRIYADEEVEGVNRAEAERIKQKMPDEGLAGISPRFVINALSNAIIQSNVKSLTTMDVLLALKDAIENDARIDPKKKRKWVDYLVLARKYFYNRWVKEDVHKALFVSFEQEAQDLAGQVSWTKWKRCWTTARSKTRLPTKSASRTNASCARWKKRSIFPIPANSRSGRRWSARRWAPTSAAKNSRLTAMRNCMTLSSNICSNSGATCCAW